MAGEGLHVSCAVLLARPGADGLAETGMVPPGRVPSRERRDDRHRLIARRWQRPLRRNLMAVGEVFEQEMPGLALLVEMPVEAARHKPRRHCWRELRIEGHFVPAAICKRLCEVGMRGLQDQRLRGAGGFPHIAQAKADNVRHDGVALMQHFHLADCAGVQHATPAERCRQSGGLNDRRQLWRCHSHDAPVPRHTARSRPTHQRPTRCRPKPQRSRRARS
ncbi:hypothetical protein ACVWWP_008395 [Bradyrhizobium sp. LM3.6]